MVVRVVEEAARRAGEPLTCCRGLKRFGGHFYRALGAVTLTLWGVPKASVMCLGRWTSCAVDRYLRTAPLRAIVDIPAAAVAGGSLVQRRAAPEAGAGAASSAC
eukprot:7115133-Heterocapsa_arctica.AAC.1